MWRDYHLAFGLQLVATLVFGALSGWLVGPHGAISAGLGGAVSLVAGLGFVALASRTRKPRSAGEALYGALRAEAVKIVLTVSLLVLALALYRRVVAVALIGTFIVTVLIFSLAPWMGGGKAVNGTDGDLSGDKGNGH